MKITRILVCCLILKMSLFGCSGVSSRAPAASNRTAETEPGVLGSNGLDKDDRRVFYHTAEGSELWPFSLLRAVNAPGTDTPFLSNENLARYGLITDDNPDGNPEHLPVGLTAAPRPGIGIKMLGVNCSACHVGQLEYKGKRFRIDGGPNMFDITAFYEGVQKALAAVDPLKHPAEFRAALHRLRLQKQLGNDEEGILSEVLRAVETGFGKDRPLARSWVEALNDTRQLN